MEISKRVEKYIQDCTRHNTNYIGFINKKTRECYYYVPWLTPEEARKAVEIARAEIYEWLNSHNDYIAVTGSITRFDMEKCITDLKQAMKDE